jgi:hypothetical protein
MKMKISELLRKFNLTSITLSTPIANTEILFVAADEEAAWAMYVELVTRSTIQLIPESIGDERAALASVYSIFATTREILKEYGRKGQTFSRIALIVLNKLLRPFTTKWHTIFITDLPIENEVIISFRNELSVLQTDLKKYAALLAEMANVENISCL